MKPIYTFVLLCALMMASCQETGNPKDTNTTTAPANSFPIMVGTTTFNTANYQIDEQPDIILRGHSNQLAVITYLNNVADGVASEVNICDAIKGEKLTTFNVWLKLVPVLTKQIPTLIRSGQSVIKFNDLYINAQGLTPDEQAAVANSFATKFTLPKEEAEKIAELVVQSTILNLKLAGTIKTAIETQKNRP